MSSIKRCLQHYLDCNVRLLNKPVLQYLTPEDILPVSKLDAWIKLPSHFCATGMGYRQLSKIELYNIFGYPLRYHTEKFGSMLHLPPFAILTTIMNALPIEKLSQARPNMLPPPMPVPDRSQIYLPSIRRWLPNDWLNVDSTSSAVKSDDAKPNLAVWGLRILPFFRIRHICSCRYHISLFNAMVEAEVCGRRPKSVCHFKGN